MSYAIPLERKHAVKLLSYTSKQSSANGGASVTSDAINTGGASLLVAVLSDFGTAAISDSLGNNWQVSSTIGTPGVTGCLRFAYCDKPKTGDAHTVTLAGTNNYPSVLFLAVSGAGAKVESFVGASSAGPATELTIGPSVRRSKNSFYLSVVGWDARSSASLNYAGENLTNLDLIDGHAFSLRAWTDTDFVLPPVKTLYWGVTPEGSGLTGAAIVFSAEEDSRRFLLGTSGGATTTNERTVAARAKARGAAATTAIHATAAAGRLRARAADAVVPIHVETVSGRVIARGADARTSIHTGTSAGRVKARAANTVEHIDAGAVSRTIAGKIRARGSAATLAIRHTSIVGRVKAKADETGTSTRLSLAAGRVRTRAAIAAAPVVPGMVITTAAGRIQARSAIVTTATRIEAIAGRVTARGTDATSGIRAATAAGRLRGRGAAAAGPYVAPTLPLEIPPSTRTIDRDPARLGLSPISPTKPRLG